MREYGTLVKNLAIARAAIEQVRAQLACQGNQGISGLVMQPVWPTIEFPPQGWGVRIGLPAEMPAKPAPMMMTSVSVTVPALAEQALDFRRMRIGGRGVTSVQKSGPDGLAMDIADHSD